MQLYYSKNYHVKFPRLTLCQRKTYALIDLGLHPCPFSLHSALGCPLGHFPLALLLLPETKCGEYGGVSSLGNLSPLRTFAVP